MTPANDDPPAPATALLGDPLLRDAPTIAGFKVLAPAVLYGRVGKGGMGAVYRGRHCKLDLDVAVKCLRPSLADEAPEFVQRFEREARIAASLAHQNIVRVMDVHRAHGLCYLLMEFVAGENARERVLRKGPLSTGEALQILLGATAGLAEAHARGFVHRDIKPDNLLIARDGRVKVADLGLAKALTPSDQSLALQSGVMGTPQYMAPEQWESPDVDARADVWALGAVFYWLLVGEHALAVDSLAALARRAQQHDFPSLRDARPGLDPALYDLLERCVARDPAARFADAGALHAVLRTLVEPDERALADPAAGGLGRDGAASPPPRTTLLRIREALETGATVPEAGEAPTLRSPGATLRMPPPTEDDGPPRRRRWPWLVALAAAALAVVAWLGDWHAALFGDDTDWDATERFARARRLYWEAKEALPRPDGLDEAIDKFEQALADWPELEIAHEPLAQALDKRAERREDDDPDAAYLAARRAAELLPQDARIAAHRDRLAQQLRDRLARGFTITAPAKNDVWASTVVALPEGATELRGALSSPGATTLSITWLARDSDRPTEGRPQPIPLVAGEFTLPLSLPPGDHPVRFVLQGRQDIGAAFVRTLRVAGEHAATGVRYTSWGARLVPLSGGTFKMGSMMFESDRENDELQHEVTLTAPFWLMDTEVTRAQWLRVMDDAPWAEQPLGHDDHDQPATHIDWEAAQTFCARLNLEQLAARLTIEHGPTPVLMQWDLPTEAQWEYACRGGSNAPHGAGIDRDSLPQFAACDGVPLQRVGSRRPNVFGLHDMLGNVAEWCADFALAGLEDGIVVTPTYLEGVSDPVSIVGSLRIHRGGDHLSPPARCRAADRSAAPPGTRSPTIGFRVALVRE